MEVCYGYTIKQYEEEDDDENSNAYNGKVRVTVWSDLFNLNA